MQTEEELSHFIEEQRARIAHDRDILKNNPPSAITDNTINRKYLKLNKENHAPIERRDTFSTHDHVNNVVEESKTRPPSTPRIFRLGDDYKRKREKLKEELRTDYRNAMAEKNLRTVGIRSHRQVEDDGLQRSGIGLSLPIKDRLSAQERMRLERNKEYNAFLHRKEDVDRERRAARSVSVSPVRNVPAATPVIKSFPAPNERNHVTSQISPIRVTGKDASYETYEELLNRKRKQEKSYRNVNDDQDDFREKSHVRDEEDDDGYYSQRRVRFPSKNRRKQKYRHREDDIEERYYSPRRRRGRGRRRERFSSSEEDDDEDSEEDVRVSRRRRDTSLENRKTAAPYEREATTGSLYATKEKKESNDLRSKSAPPDQESTGLQIGHVPSANTVQKRKDEYRDQLLQQMEEAKLAKKKARELDLSMDAALANGNDFTTSNSNRREVKGQKVEKKRQTAASPPPEEDFKPRTKSKKKSSLKFELESSSDEENDARMKRSRARHSYQRPGYFMPLAPPPQHMGYYPPQYPAPYDEAYHYYGSRNPLDPPDMLPKGHPSTIYPEGSSFLMSGAMASNRERNDFRNEEPKKGDEMFPSVNVNTRHFINKNLESTSLVADEKRDDGKKRQLMAQYQEELKTQIAQKERAKREAKQEQERYDMRIETEARNYNPWGKGGGGAPMKDRQGNLITDLRQMHLENEEMVLDPTKAEQVVQERLPQTNLYRREDRPVIDLSPRQGDGDDYNPDVISPRFGRSNPFESKQSDEQRVQRDIYKENLEKQIQEKKKLETEKRERERIEDEKEERRLEEQRRKIQAELEAEVEKDRNKKVMAERENEQRRLQAEERRREEKRKRMVENEKQDDETRLKREEEMNDRLRATNPSPVVPALQNKEVTQSPRQRPQRQTTTTRVRTPIEEERRHEQVHQTQAPSTYRAETPTYNEDRQKMRSRAESKRISRELSALRKQLLSEQRRVENQLRTVDVTTTAPPRRAQTEYLVDLSRARQKPVSVRRPPTVEKDRPSSNALKEFTDYKHRPDDTASIRMFRSEYPETPSDAKALEKQQQALIARQDRNLDAMRQQKREEHETPQHKRKQKGGYNYLPPPTAQSQASLLEAETSYIPVYPGEDDDDLEDRLPFHSNQSSAPQSRGSRRPSARERRRMANKPPSAQSEQRIPPRARADNFSLNSLSSLATLDVDRLANRNQDRLDKLRAIQGDDISLTDPDDILNRFVNKHKGGEGRRRRPGTHEDGVGGLAGPSAYRNPESIGFEIPSYNTRPPSVNTVDTEPWLRPETGPTLA